MSNSRSHTAHYTEDPRYGDVVYENEEFDDRHSEEDDDHYSHTSATHLLSRRARPPFLYRRYGGREDDIDFTSAALYVPGLQVVIALVMCCATTLVVGTALPASSMSAVRTATLSALVGLTLVARPVRILDCYGMDLVFDTIRPAVLAYLVAIIGEQLVHSCGVETEDVRKTPLKRILYHTCIAIATMAGFARAYRPTAQTDYPFLVAAFAFVTIAIVPPNPYAGHGPFCVVDGAWDAAERLARAALFGMNFCTLAYASEPARHSVSEISLAAARATAGSAWILGVATVGLPLAPLQVSLVVWRRLRSRREWGKVARSSNLDNATEERQRAGLDGPQAEPLHVYSNVAHTNDDDILERVQDGTSVLGVGDESDQLSDSEGGRDGLVPFFVAERAEPSDRDGIDEDEENGAAPLQTSFTPTPSSRATAPILNLRVHEAVVDGAPPLHTSRSSRPTTVTTSIGIATSGVRLPSEAPTQTPSRADMARVAAAL